MGRVVFSTGTSIFNKPMHTYMKKFVTVILFLSVTGLAIILVNATTTAPSTVIHQILDDNNESMLKAANKLIQQIENDPEISEIDSTFYKHPSSTRKITAQEGKNVVMIDIALEDARVKYKQHLSGVKRKGKDIELAQFSIYQN